MERGAGTAPLGDLEDEAAHLRNTDAAAGNEADDSYMEEEGEEEELENDPTVRPASATVNVGPHKAPLPADCAPAPRDLEPRAEPSAVPQDVSGLAVTGLPAAPQHDSESPAAEAEVSGQPSKVPAAGEPAADASPSAHQQNPDNLDLPRPSTTSPEEEHARGEPAADAQMGEEEATAAVPTVLPGVVAADAPEEPSASAELDRGTPTADAGDLHDKPGSRCASAGGLLLQPPASWTQSPGVISDPWHPPEDTQSVW